MYIYIRLETKTQNDSHYHQQLPSFSEKHDNRKIKIIAAIYFVLKTTHFAPETQEPITITAVWKVTVLIWMTQHKNLQFYHTCIVFLTKESARQHYC